MPTMPLSQRAVSPAQLLALTIATAVALTAVAAWTQSRMGGQLLPHAFCISASQPLLMLHLASDGLIAFAYLLIPWAMLNFVRKRKDVPFGWVVWVFGAFIVACGVTHAMHIWTLWYPVYWYAGVAKAFTAAVSLGTAWLIYRLTPMALALPSAGQLRTVNAALQQEIEARRQAEAGLAAAKAEVETLLRTVQAQARQASAVLDRFFEEAPIGLALLDSQLQPVRANLALESKTGWAVADAAGLPLDQVPWAHPEAVRILHGVAADATTRTNVELRGRRRDGSEGAWRCNFFPIQVSAGERMLGLTVQDVTEQQRMEQQRLDALAALEAADRRKDDFIAALAHELRNPLAPIGTAVHVLRRSGGLDERGQRMLEVMNRQVTHMARLIDDLLDVARIGRGTLQLRPQACDLGQVAAQVAEDHRDSLVAAGVTLHVDCQPLPVEADLTRVVQALGNYLQNAGKFAAGGHVHVLARAEGREAVVEVRDDGAGIPAELLPQLFTPFLQGPQDMARSGGGLGLGLAVTRGIAQAHGGRVAARSQGPGRGASFEFRLPLRDAGRIPQNPAPKE